jgi:aminoglycoside phosphotransferase (APT) family kinase protein
MELTDAQRGALAVPLAEFLRGLHGIDARPLLDLGLPNDEIGRINHQKRMPLTRERVATVASAGLIRDTDVFFAAMERIAPNEGDADLKTVVHGDLYSRHVLLRADASLSGIIDWGDLHFGHPGLDLAIAFIMLPPSAYESFFAEYGGAEQRTREIALYRAIYHSVLTADYAHAIGDPHLLAASLGALERIRTIL